MITKYNKLIEELLYFDKLIKLYIECGMDILYPDFDDNRCDIHIDYYTECVEVICIYDQDRHIIIINKEDLDKIQNKDTLKQFVIDNLINSEQAKFSQSLDILNKIKLHRAD
jgi:hypothetical protein